MATDDQVTAAPLRASKKDWAFLTIPGAAASASYQSVSVRCLLDLRNRVAALEAANDQATPPPVRAWNDGWPWGRAEIPSVPGISGPAPAPAPAPAAEGSGLTVEQLAECLPGNAWQNSPEGYSRLAFARHLLAHPITGPRLRAAAPGTAAPAGGVTEVELREALEDSTWPEDVGYAARYLLHTHPRIGPLLRGEGGKRVVLAERPPLPEHPTYGPTGWVYANGYRDSWLAARAEVARQQGEAV